MSKIVKESIFKAPSEEEVKEGIKELIDFNAYEGYKKAEEYGFDDLKDLADDVFEKKQFKNVLQEIIDEVERKGFEGDEFIIKIAPDTFEFPQKWKYIYQILMSLARRGLLIDEDEVYEKDVDLEGLGSDLIKYHPDIFMSPREVREKYSHFKNE